MAIQKLVTGAVSWTSCFGTEINSLTSNYAILSSVSLSNATNLDLMAEVSVSLGSVTPGSGAPFIGLYIYPLNQDTSSYGDGRFSTAAAGPPPSSYWVGNIPCVPSTAGVITGDTGRFILPLGAFKFVLWNNSGTALASSANTVKYQTTNYQVA